MTYIEYKKSLCEAFCRRDLKKRGCHRCLALKMKPDTPLREVTKFDISGVRKNS